MTWYGKQGSKRIAMVALLLGATLLVPGLGAAAAPPGATQTTINETGNTYFGRATDVDGNRMIAGDATAQKAYIYVRGASGWQLEATLAGTGQNAFGDAVAISGDIAAVSRSDGLVQTFHRSGNAWTLNPGGCFCGVSAGGSGDPLDLSGKLLAAGASNQVFLLDLNPDGSVIGVKATFTSAFGYRVFLTGGQLVFGDYSGHVKVYDVSNPASPILRQDLAPYSLSTVTGDYMLMGNSVGKGVFKRGTNGLWSSFGTITPPSGRSFDWNGGINAEGVVAATLNQPPITGSTVLYRPTASGYVLMDSIDGTWNYGLPKFSATDFMEWGCTYNPTQCGLQVFNFDADGDDLAKWTELRIGTDYAKYDTDGDLWGDGQEYRCGVNPLDQLAFPTVACEGKLPGGLRAEALAGSTVDSASATVRGATGPQDLDGDNVPDLAESRVCSTAGTAAVVGAAGGAAGTCASGTNYVAPVSTDVRAAVHGAFKSGDDQLAAADLSGTQGQGLPNFVNAWGVPCLVEDGSTPVDGFCTGSGGYQRYHLPPALP